MKTLTGLGLLAATLCLLASGSFAQQSPVMSSDEAARLAEQRAAAAAEMNADDVLLKQAIDTKSRANELVRDPVFTREHSEARAAEHRAAAQAIVDSSAPRREASLRELLASDELVQKQLAAAQEQDPDSDEPPVRYRLFVSQSMGRGAMQTVLDQAEVNQDMVLVFRGLKRGQKFSDIMKLITDLHVMKQGDHIPRVIIDPTLFTDNGVTVVPTLQRFEDDGTVLATARGASNPKWMEEQIRAGRRGDLGAMGATMPIAEVDMITLLKEAAANIDLEAYGKKQVEQFWAQRQFTRLPTAAVARTREVDPTVVMTETITAPDGTVLAYPGQRLNPFDAVPFTMKLVVIDARDDAQVTWARRQVLANPGKEVRVIATDFPSEGGWQEFDRLVGDIGRMVYLLEPHVAQRFGIEKVPSTVEGGNRVLIVREFARNELGQGDGNARSVSKAR